MDFVDSMDSGCDVYLLVNIVKYHVISKDDSIVETFCLSVSPIYCFCSQVHKSINVRLSRLLSIMSAGRLLPCPVCKKGVTWRKGNRENDSCTVK